MKPVQRILLLGSIILACLVNYLRLKNGSDVHYRNARAGRLHGDVGVYANGTAVWKLVFNYREVGLPPDVLLRKGGGFNLVMSDGIPLDREMEDSRPKDCALQSYDLDSTQDACVIITFYNEHNSTLLRSLHSVLNRTPPKLLREIVLVDDGSDLDWIRTSGSNYLEHYLQFLPKTRLIRIPTRKGIVGARMAGIRACEAPIFVILDSHIETNEGWLEPLLHRVQEHPTHLVFPAVNGISARNLKPYTIEMCTMGFLWRMMEHAFQPNEQSPEERRTARPHDYITSPTMSGGIFAANKAFFFAIGSYDESFEDWGVENLELSFRLWMCGGVLDCAPCSRVYHIFREGGNGYSTKKWSLEKNKMRTLSVWMDEFADLAWQTIGSPRLNISDSTARKEWRAQKGCKSFKWFLDTVNPESFVRSVPEDVPYIGPIKNEHTNFCLDTIDWDYPNMQIILMKCNRRRSQRFTYFKRAKHISPVRNDESCLSADESGMSDWCIEGQHEWDIMDDGTIRSPLRGFCLKAEVSTERLRFVDCDPTDPTQIWSLFKYEPLAVFIPPRTNLTV